MACLLKKLGSGLLVLRKERSRTMAIFLPSSVKSCEGGHGLCHHLLEKRRSGLVVLRGKGEWPWPSSSFP